MYKPAEGQDVIPEDGTGDTHRHHKKDFWSKENLNFSQPHVRHEKAAQIISRLAGGKECALLDVGCGPAALMRLLPSNVQYYGIDIAIPNPAPNLIEADLLEAPIRFSNKRFDIIAALGVFEYVEDSQSQKFAEITQLLNEDGKFIVSYWNFGHRKKVVSRAFSNVQSLDDFRRSVASHFNIDKSYPVSHNWKHCWPGRRLNRTINMQVNMNIPFISPILAVEYFFVCSQRGSLSDPRSGGRD